MAQETLPAPAEAEAKTGVVIDTDAQKRATLVEAEAVVRKNIAKYETSREVIVRSLFIIRHFGLWKMHKDKENPKKARYTNFKDYVRGEFPNFQQTPERLYQLFNDFEPKAIEEGIIEADDARDTNARTAPLRDAGRQAKTTYAQFERARDMLVNRLDNGTEEGAGKVELTQIWESFAPHLSNFMSDLEAFIERQSAEAETVEAKAS